MCLNYLLLMLSVTRLTVMHACSTAVSKGQKKERQDLSCMYPAHHELDIVMIIIIIIITIIIIVIIIELNMLL